MSNPIPSAPARQRGAGQGAHAPTTSAGRTGRIGYKFAAVPDAAREHLAAGHLKPTDLAVLTAILKYAMGDRSSAWASKGRIAELIGKSPRTVQSSIARLVACGLLAHLEIGPDLIDPRNRLRWRFFFLWAAPAPGWAVAADAAAKARRGEQSVSPPPEQPVSPKGSLSGSQMEAKRDDDDRAIPGIPTPRTQRTHARETRPTPAEPAPDTTPTPRPSSSSFESLSFEDDFGTPRQGPPPPAPPKLTRNPDPAPTPGPSRSSSSSPGATWTAPIPPRPTAAPSLHTPPEVARLASLAREVLPAETDLETRVAEALARYPAAWVETALAWAAHGKARAWGYVARLLLNWRAGRVENPAPPPRPRPPASAPIPNHNPLTAAAHTPNDWTAAEIEGLHATAARAGRDEAIRAANLLRFAGLATADELALLRTEGLL